ncbi:MAG: DUF362 domain-containing protein [Spirochaetota bacterium]
MRNTTKHHRVNAVACDHRATDEEVYQALRRVTDGLDRSWERLARASRIGIKFNQDWNPERIVMRHGHRQQLVSDPVARATLRLLRERTDAELFVVDVGVEGGRDASRRAYTSISHLLEEFGVPYIDGTTAPVTWAEVPGGGSLFDRYPVPSQSLDCDAFVSVQKAKNHRFMGVTLSLKNLFGLAALPPEGRPRAYYHHIVRLPYVLADLGRIYDPALNILDAIVCQAGEEWGPGDHPRDGATLVAGDQTIATDACATHLMGHDPSGTWPEQPFIRDQNALLCAAESGFGTVALDQIDFRSEITAPIASDDGPFFTLETDPPQIVRDWIRTTCEQALHYRDNRETFVSRYAGTYVLLQMGEVRWSDASGRIRVSRREIAGEHPEEGLWLKYVDPDEAEVEHYEVYERVLERFAALL